MNRIFSLIIKEADALDRPELMGDHKVLQDLVNNIDQMLRRPMKITCANDSVIVALVEAHVFPLHIVATWSRALQDNPTDPRHSCTSAADKIYSTDLALWTTNQPDATDPWILRIELLFKVIQD
jgi:hypothetical protein